MKIMNSNDPELTIDVEVLHTFAGQVQALRTECLLADGCCLSAEAEQYYLLSLAALDSAIRYLHIAAYRQMKKE
jgi:hypothetical protein